MDTEEAQSFPTDIIQKSSQPPSIRRLGADIGKCLLQISYKHPACPVEDSLYPRRNLHSSITFQLSACDIGTDECK